MINLWVLVPCLKSNEHDFTSILVTWVDEFDFLPKKVEKRMGKEVSSLLQFFIVHVSLVSYVIFLSLFVPHSFFFS